MFKQLYNLYYLDSCCDSAPSLAEITTPNSEGATLGLEETLLIPPKATIDVVDVEPIVASGEEQEAPEREQEAPEREEEEQTISAISGPVLLEAFAQEQESEPPLAQALVSTPTFTELEKNLTLQRYEYGYRIVDLRGTPLDVWTEPVRYTFPVENFSMDKAELTQVIVTNPMTRMTNTRYGFILPPGLYTVEYTLVVFYDGNGGLKNFTVSLGTSSSADGATSSGDTLTLPTQTVTSSSGDTSRSTITYQHTEKWQVTQPGRLQFAVQRGGVAVDTFKSSITLSTVPSLPIGFRFMLPDVSGVYDLNQCEIRDSEYKVRPESKSIESLLESIYIASPESIYPSWFSSWDEMFVFSAGPYIFEMGIAVTPSETWDGKDTNTSISVTFGIKNGATVFQIPMQVLTVTASNTRPFFVYYGQFHVKTMGTLQVTITSTNPDLKMIGNRIIFCPYIGQEPQNLLR
jgi:hypothetical protein